MKRRTVWTVLLSCLLVSTKLLLAVGIFVALVYACILVAVILLAISVQLLIAPEYQAMQQFINTASQFMP